MKLELTLKTRSIIAIIAIMMLAYLFGVATSDRDNAVHQQLHRLRNTLLGYEGALSGTFLMDVVARPKPRNQLFEAFAPHVDVVMIGDSLTEGVIWSEVFPNVKIANRGIGGDRTIDILNRMDPILALKPKKAFILAGLNDFVIGIHVEQVLNTYIKIIERLRENHVEVYIQSTVECSRLRCGKQNDDVRALNAGLAQYANEHHFAFIDLNRQLSSMQLGLLPKYTVDGSHLTADGYVVWSQMIKPYIVES